MATGMTEEWANRVWDGAFLDTHSTTNHLLDPMCCKHFGHCHFALKLHRELCEKKVVTFLLQEREKQEIPGVVVWQKADLSDSPWAVQKATELWESSEMGGYFEIQLHQK